MKIPSLILFTLILTLNLRAQQVNEKIWTKQLEQEIYSGCYKVADSLFVTDDQKKDYAKYVLFKVEQRFPNGFDNVSEDTIKKAFYDIGASYTRQSKIFTLKKWTPEYESLIKKDLYSNPALKSLSDTGKRLFCDCYLSELKKIYPNGIMEKVPKETQLKLARLCNPNHTERK